MSHHESALTSFFAPPPGVLMVAVLLIFLTPLFIHHFIYRSGSATSLPTFPLVGPVSSGKTSLMMSLESETGQACAETRTSQTPLSLECSVPVSIAGTSKFRSTSDPSLKGYKKFLLLDTPGHGKLRQLALSQISSPTSRGVIFVLDSSLSDIRGVAEYLYDVLLRLQITASSTPAPQPKRLLIACNKSDAFTALPPSKIKKLLEEEITNMRVSKSKGILDIEDDGESSQEREWLGEGGDGPFSFQSMEEAGVEVEIKGGSVEKGEWKDRLNLWIGSCL